MEWVFGGAVVFLFLSVVGQASRRLELERRVKAIEDRRAHDSNATAQALTELLKALVQLNLKLEAARTEIDETFYKKTDVA